MIIYIDKYIFLDIDECLTGTHTCQEDATCNNTIGWYNCTCNPGFDGNGNNCTGKCLSLSIITICNLNPKSHFSKNGLGDENVKFKAFRPPKRLRRNTTRSESRFFSSIFSLFLETDWLRKC